MNSSPIKIRTPSEELPPLSIRHYMWLMTCISVAFALTFAGKSFAIDSFYLQLTLALAITSSIVAGASFAFVTWLIARRMSGHAILLLKPAARFAVIAGLVELLYFVGFDFIRRNWAKDTESMLLGIFILEWLATMLFAFGFYWIPGRTWRVILFWHSLHIIPWLIDDLAARCELPLREVQTLQPLISLISLLVALAPMLALATLAATIVHEGRTAKNRHWTEMLGILLVILIQLAYYFESLRLTIPISEWQSFPALTDSIESLFDHSLLKEVR
jgi:hypothetical protein